MSENREGPNQKISRQRLLDPVRQAANALHRRRISSSDSPPSKTTKLPSVGRRRFLKSLAVIAGGAALTEVEIQAAPVGRVLAYLNSLNVLGHPEVMEGNFAQRYAVFTSIRSMIEADPKNEDLKELLVGWIGFNCAEVGADMQGLEMARDNMRHFLYGHGEKRDVTDIYIHDARIYADLYEEKSNIKSLDPRAKEKSIDEILALQFGMAMSESLHTHDRYVGEMPYSFSEPLEEIVKKLKNNTLNRLAGSVVISTYRDADVRWGLGRYSLHYGGHVQQVTQDPSGEFWNISMQPAEFSVYDLYSFKSINFSTAREPYPHALTFLDLIGITNSDGVLTKLIGHDRMADLKTRGIHFNDQDGVRLQNYRKGTPFEVVTQPFKIDSPVKFEVSAKIFS